MIAISSISHGPSSLTPVITNTVSEGISTVSRVSASSVSQQRKCKQRRLAVATALVSVLVCDLTDDHLAVVA